MPGPLEGGTVAQVNDIDSVTPKKGGSNSTYEKSFQFQM